MYGILILFWVEESNIGEETVWATVQRSGGLGFSAVAHAASWAAAGPASRILVLSSKWPRLAATAGVCTSAAGLLATWLTLAHNAPKLAYLPGAIATGTDIRLLRSSVCNRSALYLTGVGVSITLCQSDVLIVQYFKKRLGMVKTLLWCSRSVGFLLTPLLLGLLVRVSGVLHGLLVYQTVLLQLVICLLVYRKPLYLKAKRRSYELIQVTNRTDIHL